MPIYKVYRNAVQERKDKQSLSRWRWVAVVLSVGLLSTAAAMLVFSHH